VIVLGLHAIKINNQGNVNSSRGWGGGVTILTSIHPSFLTKLNAEITIWEVKKYCHIDVINSVMELGISG
jgi:hypothetical protein